jgi:glutamate-1-semialdehyde 2,1-aminomutase
VTTRYGILLVFDEIITLRLAPGGAQGRFGVTPDLTTVGKIIGGGFPVGGFGGRREVMDPFDPVRPDRISQSGTFNANPVTMAAGLATLRELTPPVYDELERRGQALVGLAAPALARHGFGIVGIGSLFNLRPSTAPARNYRDWAAMDKARLQHLHLALVNEGILLASRGLGALSVPMGDTEIQRFLEAVDRAAARVET